MKVLLSGKKGRLHESVAKALVGAQGLQVKALPVGSQLLEAVQSASAGALVFTLTSEQEVEPLRWVMQQNRSLPLVAVLPRPHSRLQELLREEGVEQMVTVQGLTATQIRSKLRESLRAPSAGTLKGRRPSPQYASDLHRVRSSLTAILGNAELALKSIPPTKPQRKQLEEILRGVEEIERTLRRLERSLGIASGVSR
ncbi:MAG: hypothetical protein HY647_03440 [Acidobacteria bacterium]|nr:hypothetical protein [Acidobacteriota bacterium]